MLPRTRSFYVYLWLLILWLVAGPATHARPAEPADVPLIAPGAHQPAAGAAVPYSERWRFGIVVDPRNGPITRYATAQLCAGWYHDRRTAFSVDRPDGMEYVQVVRVGSTTWPGERDSLAGKAAALPGSLWIIGYEPDNRVEDNRTPAEYATIYHEAHQLIKAADPTAQVANGALSQPTTLRLQWLSDVWNAYRSQYGADMPVDVWTTNNYIENETAAWGIGVPPGSTATSGRTVDLRWDGDRMDYFASQIRALRQWMAQHGQREKPLIVSEFGLPYSASPTQRYTTDRVIEFMQRTVNYMLYTMEPGLGMPTDGNRLVQRFAWYSLDRPPADYVGTQPGSNGNLFDPASLDLTRFGFHYSRLACNPARPTPTPATTPLPSYVRREAEDGQIVFPFYADTDPAASDCGYIHGYWVEGGLLTYTFYIPANGYYVVWGRARGLDTNNNSFNVSIDRLNSTDNAGVVRWYVPIRSGLDWWRVTDGLNGGGVKEWYLWRGWHWLQFDAMEQRGTQLDAIVIAPASDYNSPGKYVVACQPTLEASSTPTPSATPIATATATPTPMPTATATATATAAATATATATPTPSATPVPSATPRTSFEIRGRVWEDRNCNGTIDEGEPPLAGVTLILKDEAGQAVGYQVTGPDGRYGFEGLARGRYQLLEVDPPGYLSTTSNEVGVTILESPIQALDFGDYRPWLIRLPLVTTEQAARSQNR